MRVAGCAAVISAGLCEAAVDSAAEKAELAESKSELAADSSACTTGKSALAGAAKLGAGGNGNANAGSSCPLVGSPVAPANVACSDASGGGGNCPGGAGGGLEAEA